MGVSTKLAVGMGHALFLQYILFNFLGNDSLQPLFEQRKDVGVLTDLSSVPLKGGHKYLKGGERRSKIPFFYTVDNGATNHVHRGKKMWSVCTNVPAVDVRIYAN